MFSDLNGDGTIQTDASQVPGPVPPDYTELIQENHYYPFGLQMNGAWNQQTNPEQNYLYNGKEFNDDFGLNWSDYGARWYDSAIARWNAVDPLAEDYMSWSPYNYVMGNPIRNIDPDGRSVETDFYNKKGKKIGTDGIDNGKKYFVSNNKEANRIAASKGLVNLNDVESAVPVVSNEAVSKMDEAYKKSEATGNEHSFAIATDGSTSSIHTDNDSDKVNMLPGITELAQAGKSTQINVHTHPNTKNDEGAITHIGVAEPSGDDSKGSLNLLRKGLVNSTENIILGYSQELNSDNSGVIITKTIGFHRSGNENARKVDYSKYKKVIKKINK